tara:strand:+ start:109 stop:768 length:660 start_codon:yes stop_codon:yes gene_type:complete
MKFAIIVFPGSNCDHDAYHALHSLGFKVDYIWHKSKSLNGYDGVLIPGGFSYGDYLRTGSIACFSPIMKSIISHAKKGKIIIGICNGFQILIESGLLPGALIINKNIKFLSKNVVLKVNSFNTKFTNAISEKTLKMPIAHKQGNYTASKSTIKTLIDNDQIIFKYKNNPNGSMLDIAGIINKQRNVLGMMPHPERASDDTLGLNQGKLIFESILNNYMK